MWAAGGRRDGSRATAGGRLPVPSAAAERLRRAHREVATGQDSGASGSLRRAIAALSCRVAQRHRLWAPHSRHCDCQHQHDHGQPSHHSVSFTPVSDYRIRRPIIDRDSRRLRFDRFRFQVVVGRRRQDGQRVGSRAPVGTTLQAYRPSGAHRLDRRLADDRTESVVRPVSRGAAS